MTESAQPASVGRIVHYVSHGTPVRDDGSQAYSKRCRAAIVTEVKYLGNLHGPALVGLCAVNPTGLFWHPIADGGCEFDPGDEHTTNVPWSCDGVEHSGGSWHWPERV